MLFVIYPYTWWRHNQGAHEGIHKRMHLWCFKCDRAWKAGGKEDDPA
jgi:hypothetical protein